MKYIYFVSYSHGKNALFGFGCVEIIRNNPIKSMDDIASIHQLLQNRGTDNPIIISYQLLRTEE